MILQVINGNEPVIEKQIMNTGGVVVEFGLHRERDPEGMWKWTTMEKAREVNTNNLPPTERGELVHIIVEDLLGWYGTGRPLELRAKLEEFGVEFNFK